ncbi:hypothetical protein JCM10296v2_005177 [Rhodotorula toruloides]
MVLLRLTPALRSRLDVLASRLPEELREQIAIFLVDEEEERASGGFDDDCAEGAGGAIKEQRDRTVPHELLSPELLAILADIQLQQDRRSYASLSSLAPAPHPSLIPLDDPFSPKSHKTPAEEWKEIRREVSAIANVGASMLAVGTGVWWVGGGRSYAARLCLALSGALAIAIIEGWLYWRFFSRVDTTLEAKAGSGKAATRVGGRRRGVQRNSVKRVKTQ